MAKLTSEVLSKSVAHCIVDVGAILFFAPLGLPLLRLQNQVSLLTLAVSSQHTKTYFCCNLTAFSFVYLNKAQ